MRICALGSGSSGNALLVEGPGGYILVDAGLPWREIKARAKGVGFHLSRIEAVVVTHEHRDHVAGLGTLLRRGVRVLGSPGTLKALGLGPRRGVPLRGEAEVAGLALRPFRVPHDAVEPIGLRISDGEATLGIATDLGDAPEGVMDALRGSDLLVFEANHDLTMLLAGPYPWPLKLRILSPLGHLSNDAAGSALSCIVDGAKAVLLAHLSRENNTPALALETVARYLDGWDGGLYLTYRDRPSPPIGFP